MDDGQVQEESDVHLPASLVQVTAWARVGDLVEARVGDLVEVRA